MDESVFEFKLNELVNEIGSIPSDEKKKLIMLAKKTHNAHKKFSKTISQMNDSLDYLRVCVKYLMFDLEATKRENEYLRKLLEEEK